MTPRTIAPRGPALPVDEALPDLVAALGQKGLAVLVAPPGAGKTTRVPLALIGTPWCAGKVIMLEPRRIAARAAAERMAWTIGETAGENVGYRVRLQSRIGPRTRVEIVTEGVFTRMILADPGLDGVSAVIFDEFHERSLDGDLGLALALDARGALRPDLRILVMSATIDGARVASLLGDAPVIRSEGRAFPVETRYRGRDQRQYLEPQIVSAVLDALANETGSILVFLPGAREIRRTETLLSEKIRDPAVDLAPLHGTMEPQAQDRAIAPAPPGRRKIVLATSIAETSLTIEGVRVVIDSGLARVPRYDPATGLTGLATIRVSRAAADQRRGRAGRVEPGVCYRLWDEAETRALPDFAPPEIREADLAPLALSLAEWGTGDPGQLAWLDPPPRAAFEAARDLLRELGAIDPDGRLTGRGRDLARLPLPPRLAAMVLAAGDAASTAAALALLLTERGLGGREVDLAHRLRGLVQDRSDRARAGRQMAESWVRLAGAKPGPIEPDRAGAILALAYPDRIAKARPGQPGRYLLANGKGAELDPSDPLARHEFLVVADLSGAGPTARIVLAAAIDEQSIEQDFADRIATVDEVRFDPATGGVRSRRMKRFGKLVLQESPSSELDPEQVRSALLQGIADLGVATLPWTKDQERLRSRVEFLRALEPEAWPDLSDAGLNTTLADWLGPFLTGKRSIGAIGADDLGNALAALVPWDQKRRLDEDAPSHFEAPTGSMVPIDYGAEGGPSVAIRVQELFGLAKHPTIGAGKVPLTLALLSPAHRPIQITRDLPGFWAGSWKDVRSDMRGRYPKHVWPDDPANAQPTRRAKPRGT